VCVRLAEEKLYDYPGSSPNVMYGGSAGSHRDTEERIESPRFFPSPRRLDEDQHQHAAVLFSAPSLWESASYQTFSESESKPTKIALSSNTYFPPTPFFNTLRPIGESLVFKRVSFVFLAARWQWKNPVSRPSSSIPVGRAA